jgi:hypothetical protein
MSLSYAWEQFYGAVRGLASWTPIQKRLRGAYGYHLIHVKVEDLPESIRDDFRQLKAKLTSGKPTAGEGTVAAFCNGLTKKQAKGYADRIIAMYDTVARHLGPRLGDSQ